MISNNVDNSENECINKKEHINIQENRSWKSTNSERLYWNTPIEDTFNG